MRLWIWALVGLTAFIVLSLWKLTRPTAPPTAQVPTVTATATPEPGPRGRPPHLLGHLPDGCELLPISEAASIVGRPLEFDAFMLLQSWRNGWVDCAYTERATFFPKRPRYQVSFRLSRRDSGRESDLVFLEFAPNPGAARVTATPSPVATAGAAPARPSGLDTRWSSRSPSDSRGPSAGSPFGLPLRPTAEPARPGAHPGGAVSCLSPRGRAARAAVVDLPVPEQLI